MKTIYQFSVALTVTELRRELAKLVEEDAMEEGLMVRIVKEFAEEKKKETPGQRFITIM